MTKPKSKDGHRIFKDMIKKHLIEYEGFTEMQAEIKSGKMTDYYKKDLTRARRRTVGSK